MNDFKTWTVEAFVVKIKKGVTLIFGAFGLSLHENLSEVKRSNHAWWGVDLVSIKCF